MFRTEFIRHEDNLYILKRKFKEEYKPNIEAWKEQLGADKVLKKDGVLYFVELIPEAEIIEEILDNPVTVQETPPPSIESEPKPVEETPKEELKQE